MSTDTTDNEASNDIQTRVYNIQEHAVIDKFKDKYLEAMTSSMRKTIAQLEIFPALFNYWKGIGKIYDNKKTRMKSNVCVAL